MKSTTYRNYLLAVLLLVFAFNQVDRLALGLLLQNIKADLHLSDTQLGLVNGIAFAFFYSIMGIPIARWADRGNRVTIISLTVALWSAMVAICGFAANFVQLILMRAGVAVGEAGCIPPANSLIADYFSRAERPRAISLYLLGGPLSVLIGFFLAGWLNEFYGWRATFIFLGLPGLPLAALAWFTLREPRNAEPNAGAFGEVPPAASRTRTQTMSPPQPDFREVCATLWANKTFRHLLLGFSVVSFFGTGIGLWQPAFFIRSYGLNTGELGTWFTVIYGLGGMLGTLWGGDLATRYAANNERLQLKGMAIVYSSFGIVSSFIYLSPNRHVAFALMAVTAVGGATISGPLFATIQTLVPARMRATSVAIVYLCSNMIGMGLGPLAAGALSDVLRPHFGEESLRYALLCLCPGYFWAGWHLWRSTRTVTHDVLALQNTPNVDDIAGNKAFTSSTQTMGAS